MYLKKRIAANRAKKIIAERARGRPVTVRNAIISALYTDPGAVKEMLATCHTEEDVAKFRYKRYDMSGSDNISPMLQIHYCDLRLN